MASAELVSLLGPKLVKQGGDTVDTDVALSGCEAVALYFSAHWCGPCRGFTPELAKMYSSALKAKGLEVIFVSSDKTEAEFDSYFKEQPWLALPYADRAKKAALNKKFKVEGIPTLVILDGKTGETITTDGREAVSEDPTGKNFPWKPPSFWEALGTEFLKGTDGETVDVDEIKGAGKVIGLYFSAHWCPPCRAFTPQLIDAYTNHLKAKNLEIIFVSSDRSGPDFEKYFATMPWLAIPNGDKRKDPLSKRFGVRGIPSFVLVDGATGETISSNARGKVSSDPTGAEFPWLPKALMDMVADGPEGINEELTLCAMLEGCDAPTTAAAKAVLEPIAEASKAAGEGTLFMYAPATGGPTDQIRQMMKLGSPTAAPQMILLDIPDDGGYYVSPATEVTAETVKGFLEAYKAGALERQQLG
jgi:nucleoredoxin